MNGEGFIFVSNLFHVTPNGDDIRRGLRETDSWNGGLNLQLCGLISLIRAQGSRWTDPRIDIGEAQLDPRSGFLCYGTLPIFTHCVTRKYWKLRNRQTGQQETKTTKRNLKYNTWSLFLLLPKLVRHLAREATSLENRLVYNED